MYKTGIQHRFCCKQNHYNTAKSDYLKKIILLKIDSQDTKKKIITSLRSHKPLVCQYQFTCK